MKKIILFDTSVGTLNHGDEIIMESFVKNAEEILRDNFTLRFPTHTPCFHFYQQLNRNYRYKYVKNADYKFICGTNILNNKMMLPWQFWNINIFNSRCYENAVLVGVGCSGFRENDKMSLYSKMLYSGFLSKKYKHSVRDERTKKLVEFVCGTNSAINTGCPTIWGLTKKHCEEIDTMKAKNVVFTLTDYSVNREEDRYLVDTLLKNYDNVYFWPQGTGDNDYFDSLQFSEKVKKVSPGIREYSKLLSEGNIDYVGTRLHAGIYAMQHKVRSIIISVDNRAADMSYTYNINTVSRGERCLEDVINSEIITNVNINEEAIKEWKSQFLI